jgi:hypothetical protein
MVGAQLERMVIFVHYRGLIMAIKCTDCKNCNLKEEKCDEELWDRADEDQEWIHSESDYNLFLEEGRFCSDYDTYEGSGRVGLGGVNETVAMLQRMPKEAIGMDKFRSGGSINGDYDMGRVTIDLPIKDARKLLAALKAI